MAAVGLAACGGSSGPLASGTHSTKATQTVPPTTTTSAPATTPTTLPPPTTTLPPTTTTSAPPPTTTSTGPSNGLTGYGATIHAWDEAHSSDGKYEGFASYGPTVSTPEGPTPQFIAVQNDGSNIISFIESLPDGTSLAAAKQIALESLPSDTLPQSFVVSDQNGSCGFWNLTSQTLATAGQGGAGGSVSIEMAYDDSNGSPHYEPNNINTLSFEIGINDSSGTC